MEYVVDPINPNNIMLKTVQYTEDGKTVIATILTPHCCATQLIISGPTSLVVGTPGDYTLTFKDWQGNSLQTNNTVTIHTIDASGDKQDIAVNVVNGTGTFQFSSAVAGTYTLSAQTQNTLCDILPQGGLQVVIS